VEIDDLEWRVTIGLWIEDCRLLSELDTHQSQSPITNRHSESALVNPIRQSSIGNRNNRQSAVCNLQ